MNPYFLLSLLISHDMGMEIVRRCHSWSRRVRFKLCFRLFGVGIWWSPFDLCCVGIVLKSHCEQDRDGKERMKVGSSISHLPCYSVYSCHTKYTQKSRCEFCPCVWMITVSRPLARISLTEENTATETTQNFLKTIIQERTHNRGYSPFLLPLFDDNGR